MGKEKSRQSGRLFSELVTYISILCLCFTVYIVIVIISADAVGRERYQLSTERIESAVLQEIDSRMYTAEEIISRINYSLTFRDLYFSVMDGRNLDTITRVNVSRDLANAYAQAGATEVDEILLFLDDESEAFSSVGIVLLDSPFEHMSFPVPYLVYDSPSDMLNTNSSRFTFREDNMLYLQGFRYQGGTERGVICISFNARNFIEAVADAAAGEDFELRYNDRVVYSSSGEELDGSSSLITSSVNPRLAIRIAMPAYHFSLSDPLLLIGVIAGLFTLAVSLMIIIRRFLVTYRQLKAIRSLVPVNEHVGDKEVEAIISDLRGMVVRYNEYRDSIDDMSRFAQAGVIHEVADGLTDEGLLSRYAGFVKPYYAVLAFNIDFAGNNNTGIECDQYFDRLKNEFTTDSLLIFYYRRDFSTYFVYLNSDDEPDLDQIPEELKMFLSGALPPAVKVTVGVDRWREELSDFRKACDAALSALSLMVVQGKDDIYYAEDQEGSESGYYVPENLDQKLLMLVRSADEAGIRTLFDEILKTNLMKYSLDAESVSALSAHIYYSLLKCMKSLIPEGTLQRADEYATVEDVFSHYLDAVLSWLPLISESKVSEPPVYAELTSYVDSHFADIDLSLGRLSDMFHISTKSIGNYFSSHYGRTYLQYVTTLRIEKAARLLAETEDAIDSVAAASGYTSSLSFRRNFKEEKGCTPSEYRIKYSILNN